MCTYMHKHLEIQLGPHIFLYLYTHIHTIHIKCIKVVLGLRSTKTCVCIHACRCMCVCKFRCISAYVHAEAIGKSLVTQLGSHSPCLRQCFSLGPRAHSVGQTGGAVSPRDQPVSSSLVPRLQVLPPGPALNMGADN